MSKYYMFFPDPFRKDVFRYKLVFGDKSKYFYIDKNYAKTIDIQKILNRELDKFANE